MFLFVNKCLKCLSKFEIIQIKNRYKLDRNKSESRKNIEII